MSEYIVTVRKKFSYCGKNSAANWEEKPDSVPRARGTSRPKMVKPTVLLTGAKVTQEKVDYSTDKQASNSEEVSRYKWSPRTVQGRIIGPPGTIHGAVRCPPSS